MKTFKDWLQYYNNLDIAPGLEALGKMKAFYTEKGIDLFKDAVSIPGVSLHYLLKGSIERGAELYSPSAEAYEMLKGTVVGGPSIVFTRYYEAGVTEIRPHRVQNPKTCKKILGYDANALYLSTMLHDMPCGKETVRYYRHQGAADWITQAVQDGSWFGFAELDIRIPPGYLILKFEEMCPFFVNKMVEDAPEHMKEYLRKTGRRKTEGKKLVGALSAGKMLVYAPLLK